MAYSQASIGRIVEEGAVVVPAAAVKRLLHGIESKCDRSLLYDALDWRLHVFVDDVAKLMGPGAALCGLYPRAA